MSNIGGLERLSSEGFDKDSRKIRPEVAPGVPDCCYVAQNRVNLGTPFMSARLFTPFRIGNLTLVNRVVIAPMCQYSAVNGSMTDWHVMHLGQLAMSGAALLTIEATAVTSQGRISNGDTGLWSDANEAAMARVLDSVRRYTAMPVAIQLAHAGRKASSEVPWRGGGQIPPGTATGWQSVAPSAIPFQVGHVAPLALDRAQMKDIRQAFAQAVKRAARIGFDAIEIHAAHGYLLHSFLSPLSNKRTDSYGGSLENRMRFPLEVFEAVRDAFPTERPVIVRVSGTDWCEGGWDIVGTIALSLALQARGCSAIHISSGGISPDQKIILGPSYQVPLARAVKAATTMPVIAVGLITDFEQAEAIVSTGDADLIALARAILYDPRWPWHAAAYFGEMVKAPPQYFRCMPRQYKTLFEK
jgi:2,4-dienoyl-CoA reductase-like NADH-dependent reductase (Old Yellow Enzyme family)